MQKNPNREEKEKFKNNFSTFERRKRNPNSFASSREEKEKSRIFLPSFERRKRNLEFLCPVSRREREIGKYIKLSRRQKIRVVKTFPFCNLCLTQCQDEVRNQLGSWVKVKVVK